MDALEFITSPEPVSILGSINKLSFESEASREKHHKSAETTDVIKVLGKKELKDLLKCRLGQETRLQPRSRQKTIEVSTLDDIDEAEQAVAAASEESRLDRVHRRQKNEFVQKQVKRMQLGIIIPTDNGLEQDGSDGQSLFSLTNINKLMVHKGDANVYLELFNKEMNMKKALSQVNMTPSTRRSKNFKKSGSDDEESEGDEDDTMDATVPQNNDTFDLDTD
ncbi:hypothetical protein BGZ65_001012 [Modicella reniformis]|uniref:DUF3381 domain-containing protein n=1 Tax=Modicella reniformis TaxID=1440133 RepID=A0A9P6J2M5_9FUNG|nr:hypothetical protein BGZ65_001012 [Modicella reniformis]